MKLDECEELRRFCLGEIDPAGFKHDDHVRLGFAMVCERGFLASLPLYAGAIKMMAQKAGLQNAYNETITTAFLSLIAEHALTSGSEDYATFARVNPEIFDSAMLTRHYSKARLSSPLAKTTFLLPDLGIAPS